MYNMGDFFLCESHSSEKFYTLILLSTAYLHVKIPPAIIYAGQKNETNHNMLVKSAWAKPYIYQLNHSFVLFKKHLTVQMQTIIVSATFNVPFKSTLSWLFDDGQKVLSIHCSAERVTNCGGRESERIETKHKFTLQVTQTVCGRPLTLCSRFSKYFLGILRRNVFSDF